MEIQPFHFQLEHVDRARHELSEALFQWLPRLGSRAAVVAALEEALTKHVGLPLPFTVESVTETTVATFAEQLPDPCVVVVMGMPPVEDKIFLDFDPETAHLLIEKMLGSQGASASHAGKLSDIEEGVLQYLVLQVLAHLHRLTGGHPRLHFRFERFALVSSDVTRLASARDAAVVLTIRLTLGETQGFVRLCFPHPFMATIVAQVDQKVVDGSSERAYLRERLTSFDYLRFPLWAEVGRTSLEPVEMKGLDVGDVVMLDEAQVILRDGVPAGKVILRAGRGLEGGMVATVGVSERDVKCQLIERYQGV
ncbi:MAG: hypothetical protein HY465_03680 [Deltaproteobacteria bacterium]|nr:hypothetical protein [Deltaproteobacteria bacterium]